jgi:hypothetical protein
VQRDCPLCDAEIAPLGASGAAVVHHHGKTDDLWARLEVSKRGVLGHLGRVGRPLPRIKKVPLTAPKLLVPNEITLVPPGTLPRTAYKSKLVDWSEAGTEEDAL